MKIILASASPRRNQILTDLGVSFERLTAPAEEINHMEKGGEPSLVAIHNAAAKAGAVFDMIKGREEEALIIGADTIVAAKGGILPKPENPRHAEEMLKILSGITHQVITGLAIRVFPGGNLLTGSQSTRVTFRRLSKREIRLYVESGEPMDKAGAYGIQGFGIFLVERVIGDYPNVVGLPIMKLFKMLKPLGVDLFCDAVTAGAGKDIHVI